MFPLPTTDRLIPRPLTQILKAPPMIRNRTLFPRQVVVVSLRSIGGKSSPVTIGPVPSPSTGWLMVTAPSAILPVTPPPAAMTIFPSAARTDRGPDGGRRDQHGPGRPRRNDRGLANGETLRRRRALADLAPRTLDATAHVHRAADRGTKVVRRLRSERPAGRSGRARSGSRRGR